MKKNLLKQIFVGAIVVMGISMASCTTDDVIDNGNGNINDGNSAIYQDPNLKPMNENQFVTKVRALTRGFDQSIVDALNANDRITDVKPYKRVFAINKNTGEYTSDTAMLTWMARWLEHVVQNSCSEISRM